MLGDLGFACRVVTSGPRDVARAISECGPHESVSIVDPRLVCEGEALANLLDNPQVSNGLLLEAHPAAERSGDIVHADGRVLDVGSGSGVTAGILVLSPESTLAAARALDGLGSGSVEGGFQGIVRVLVRAGLPCAAVSAQPFAAAIDGIAPPDTSQASRRLAWASRSNDGFYSTFVLRPLSRRVTGWALPRGISPNAITLVSLAIGLCAAAAFATGARIGLMVGALLLQASLVADCVDGEIARYRRRFTSRGAWLDGSTDRVKEYAVYAGLAIGAARSGSDVWILATAVMALQVFAHLGAFSWDLVREDERTPYPGPRPLDAPALSPPAAKPGMIEAWSSRTQRGSAGYWLKKAIHFPIGERWLVISIVAAVANAWWVFGVLLALNVLATAYSYAGRILRSLQTPRVPLAPERNDFSDRYGSLLDAGVLLQSLSRAMPLAPRLAPITLALAVASVVGGLALFWQWPLGPTAGAVLLVLLCALAFAARVNGNFRWAPSPLLRLVEFGTVLALWWRLESEQTWLVFSYVFVVCLVGYDATYRRRILSEAPPQWLCLTGPGFEVRVLVLTITAALGGLWWESGLAVLSLVALVNLVALSIDWFRRTN